MAENVTPSLPVLRDFPGLEFRHAVGPRPGRVDAVRHVPDLFVAHDFGDARSAALDSGVPLPPTRRLPPSLVQSNGSRVR